MEITFLRFLLSLWLACCLSQLFSTASGSHDVKRKSPHYFWQMPLRKMLFTLVRFLVRSNKDIHCEGGSSREPQTGQAVTVLWEWSLEFQLCFAHCSGCQSAGFHCDCGILAFKATAKLGRRGWGQLKPHRTCCFLLSHHFSWVKILQTVTSL